MNRRAQFGLRSMLLATTVVGGFILAGDWFYNSDSRKQEGLYRRIAKDGGTLYVHELGVQVTWGYVAPLPSGVEIRVIHPSDAGCPDIRTLEALCEIRDLTYVDLGRQFRPTRSETRLLEWLQKRGVLEEYNEKGRRVR